MPGTSVGAAIDYLYSGTNLVSGVTLKNALLAVDTTVTLADTLPVANQQSMVVIGRSDFDQELQADKTDQYVVIGRAKVQEEYDIGGYVECYRNGPEVRTARNAAIALYDVVLKFIWDDATLGGLLKDGRIARISASQVQITGGKTEKGDTRMALLPFTIHVQNQYVPS